MSPLGLYGAFALILVASLVVGWGVLAATGRRAWSWLAPGVGLAVLVVLSSVTVILPGRGVTAAAAFAVAMVGSAVLLRRVRPAAQGAVRVGLPVALLALLATAVPFAAGGGLEVMGTYVNNDLAFHLYNAEWLRAREGIEPAQIANGYPIGPHGLVVAVAGLTGIDLPAVWTGLLIAIVVVTTLISLTVLQGLRPGTRVLGALLVGLPYLGAAFYVQSAFKETLIALFTLGFALALREAVGEDPDRERGARVGRLRTATPPILFAAASLATYSGPGLAWTVGALGVWVVLVMTVGDARRRRWAVLRKKRWPIPVAAVGFVLAALFVVAAWGRSAELIGGEEIIGEGALGNLFAPLPPYQAFGVWLSNDYRVLDSRMFPIGGLHLSLLGALAVVAVGFGVVRLAKRRELFLLSALGTGVAVYVMSRYSLGPYVGSKALAVLAPLAMLVAILGLAPTAEGRASPRWRTTLFAAFAAAALASSYVALAGARLDNDDHASQLAEFRSEVTGDRVLFLGSDEYAPWYLRGASIVAPVGAPPGLYTPKLPGAARTGERVDFDTVPTKVLDEADYAITPRSHYGSEPPRNFEEVDSTQAFVLWRRTGPTPSRLTLFEGQLPGEVLDCDTSRGRRISELEGRAHLFRTPPVVLAFGPPQAAGGTSFLLVNEGEPATREVRLPGGRWEISLQYHSQEPLIVDSPSLLRRELPANSARIGPYWPLGTVDVRSARDVAFTVEPRRRPLLRRLLGGPDAVRTGHESLIGALAAVRVDEKPETAPLSQACGRFVDSFELRHPSKSRAKRLRPLIYGAAESEGS